MTTRDSTVLQVRIDGALKQAFADAARREEATAADMLRRLICDFVRASKVREAQRQSLLVSSAPDAQESLELLNEVQDFGDR